MTVITRVVTVQLIGPKHLDVSLSPNTCHMDLNLAGAFAFCGGVFHRADLVTHHTVQSGQMRATCVPRTVSRRVFHQPRAPTTATSGAHSHFHWEKAVPRAAG